MVARVLRYVSNFPWGSPGAEAGRRSASLQQIVDRIWADGSHKTRQPFVAGSSVQWTPVIVTEASIVKYRPARGKGDRLMWLVSRQRPINSRLPSNPLIQNLKNDCCAASIKDGTPGASVLDVLYDRRFLVSMNLHLLPEVIQEELSQTGSPQPSALTMEPHSKYFLPALTWRREGGRRPSMPIAMLLPSGDMHFPILENNKDDCGIFRLDPQSIQMNYIRSLDAA